jgi:ATP-dependent Lhr-like helicase
LPEALDREIEASDAIVAVVRGRIEYCGPTTAGELAAQLGISEPMVAAALEALEGRGSVLRGNFFAGEPGSETAGEQPVGWCDRRLLARIHRLTLAGLRRQIQPVEPRDFVHFLTKHHHLGPRDQWGGAVGVREAIAQLQGFELPAGAWESRVLAARVAEYDPDWLDQLFLSGEAVWGRLNPPRRDEEDRPSSAALSRVVPISLLLREELPGLLPVEPPPPGGAVRSGAEAVLEALKNRGALFFAELKSLAQLLPTQLEEALRELAAAGLVTSDGFAAVRAIVKDHRGGATRRRSRRPVHGPATPVGRWSLFPGPVHAGSREQYLEAWCRQLLRRWGVVFRDLLVREASAPRWGDLVRVLRLMELRGEVRGGRFVGGVAGEQYALPAAVDQLREARRELEESEGGEWIVISAADPVNVFGVVTPGARIAATHRNALVIRGGRLIAARQAGVVEFYEPLDAATQWAMRRAMTLGRRVDAALEPPEAVPAKPSA